MKHLHILLFTCVFALNVAAQNFLKGDLQTDSSVISITARLRIPFGTIAMLDAEIYSGDSLRLKRYVSTYFLKINSVNGKKIEDTIILRFEDETGKLPGDVTSLFNQFYGEAAKSMTDKQAENLEKQYIGKKITLIAYETGHFTGLPDGYFKYRNIKAGTSFYFEQYLIVLSIVSNRQKSTE